MSFLTVLILRIKGNAENSVCYKYVVANATANEFYDCLRPHLRNFKNFVNVLNN